MTGIETGLMVASAVGTILDASSSITAGNQKKASDDYLATVQRNNANAAMASSQRQSIDQQRQADYTASRVRAVAAASGGTSTDPTVVTNIQNIMGEGEYRAMSSIYEGDTKAQALRSQADISEWEGQNAQDSGYLKAGSTFLDGASSMYRKYAVPFNSQDNQTQNGLRY